MEEVAQRSRQPYIIFVDGKSHSRSLAWILPDSLRVSGRPSPESGIFELPFLGHALLVDIPLPHQAQFRIFSKSSIPVSPGAVPLLVSQPASSLSELLRELVDQLWLIWELVLLAEPILIYSPGDPRRCSELVQWLVNIIRPLPFAGDYRPFFHMYAIVSLPPLHRR